MVPPANVGSSPKKGKRKVRFTKPGQQTLPSDGKKTFEPLPVNFGLPRYLVDTRLPSTTGITTQAALEDYVPPHPSLPYTDAELEERFKALKVAAWRWATENFNSTGPNASVVFDLLRFSQAHPHLMEYLNFVASCPKDQTWEEFFNSKKAYLAFAVLGKALEVHVFGQEMFGASDTQVKILRSMDLEMLHMDGFIRQKARASIINGFLSTHTQALPPNFLSALTDLQARMLALLSPLHDPPTPPSPFHQTLSHILLSAARLALDMRREPSTIYYLTPIFKETPLDPNTTHVINSTHAPPSSPHHHNYEESTILIAAWPCIEAYRPGLSRNTHHNPNTPSQPGLRVRRICLAEAYIDRRRQPTNPRPSLRTDLSLRRGRINLPNKYLASGIGILLAFLALGATTTSNHGAGAGAGVANLGLSHLPADIAHRVIETASAFGAEVAAGAGTLEEVVVGAVRKMVDAAV